MDTLLPLLWEKTLNARQSELLNLNMIVCPLIEIQQSIPVTMSSFDAVTLNGALITSVRIQPQLFPAYSIEERKSVADNGRKGKLVMRSLAVTTA